jgi:hypothetical protein
MVLVAGLLAACTTTQPRDAVYVSPQKKVLTVRADGKMVYRDRLVSPDDVILYEDGRGGLRAAVRVRTEPLRPDFFADGIVVEHR